MTLPVFNDRLCKMNLQSKKEDIVYPTLAIIWYLKSKNFNKTVFCLGPKAMKSELEEAGFKVANTGVSTSCPRVFLILTEIFISSRMLSRKPFQPFRHI